MYKIHTMAEYIVLFLLPLSGWFILESCLVNQDKLEENDNLLKVGFTWHYWELPNDLLFEIKEILKKEFIK